MHRQLLVNLILICSLSWIPQQIFCFVSRFGVVVHPNIHSKNALESKSSDIDSNDGDDDNTNMDMSELKRRMEELSMSEARSLAAFEDGLYRRVRDLAQAEQTARQADGSTTSQWPVITWDAILPGQSLSGRTTDATFSRLLRDLGLGGLFVMISLDPKSRSLRRHGTLCRIELVDADKKRKGKNSSDPPTAVDFTLVGKQRCRLVGPATNMKQVVGRWRRGYDPDGEETMLGWGEERFRDFLSSPSNNQHDDNKNNTSTQHCSEAIREANLPSTEWSLNTVQMTDLDNPIDETDEAVLTRMKGTIEPLLDEWLRLASNPQTYDNIEVVAGTRRRNGEPGLSVNADQLLRKVLQTLGPRPKTPTDFAVWGAALINPIPPLGVSPELRGNIMEAPNITAKFNILERGVLRSIRNLNGTCPL